MNKLLKLLAFAAVLASTPAWASDSYLFDFTGANSSQRQGISGGVISNTYGSVYGNSVVDCGINSNALYIHFRDASGTTPGFLGGYVQRFGTVAGSLRNFSDTTMSIDMWQTSSTNQFGQPIPAAALPEGAFFSFSVAIDSNGDGKFSDPELDSDKTHFSHSDSIWRTKLVLPMNEQTGEFPPTYPLPGTDMVTLSTAVSDASFLAGNWVFDGGNDSRLWDLTKVSRVSFLFIQGNESDRLDMPSSGDMTDGVDYQWKFDNLSVQAIPEAGTFALMAMGLLGLGAFLRRK